MFTAALWCAAVFINTCKLSVVNKEPFNCCVPMFSLDRKTENN